MHRRQRSLPVLGDLVVRQQGLELLVRHQLDLVDLVRRPEAVHKVQKGDARFERGDGRNQGQIVGLLDAEGAQHGESAAADQHGVAVVAVNGEGLAGEGATGDVNDGRQELAGDFVEVGNVQEQPLTGREGGGQGARDQGAVQGAG